jgi:hypothetical protein
MMQMKKSLTVATRSLFFSLCLHTIAQGQSKVVKKGKTHDGFVWVKNRELKDLTVFAFGIDWKRSN